MRVRSLEAGGRRPSLLVTDEAWSALGGRESGWLPEAGSLLVTTLRLPVGGWRGPARKVGNEVYAVYPFYASHASARRASSSFTIAHVSRLQ